MAGLAALLFKPALDAALAGTAAKGTMNMNKKKEDSKILDDGTKTSKKKKEKAKEPETSCCTLFPAKAGTDAVIKIVNVKICKKK